MDEFEKFATDIKSILQKGDTKLALIMMVDFMASLHRDIDALKKEVQSIRETKAVQKGMSSGLSFG